MIDKSFTNVEEVVADIPDGSTIAIPGFFAAGVPRILLQALIKQGTRDLTLTCGCGPLLGAHEELIQLVKNGQITKVVDSYGLYRSASKGGGDVFEQAIRKGEIELEVVPMGTLAERYRAAGSGIPAFYTPTGVGSIVEEQIVTNIVEHQAPKETRVIDGKKYILEYALKPDYAFVHAYMGDKEGNLRYRMTAKNFNHVMATAATVTFAEVENLVEAGELGVDDVHTPGVYVDRLIKVPRLTFAVTID